MIVRAVAFVCVLLALSAGAPRRAAAAPGDPVVAERARLAADRGLTALAPVDGAPGRLQAGPPVASGTAPGGRDGWQLVLITRRAIVASELLTITTPGRPYDAFTDGRALASRAFGRAVAADLAGSRVVARQQQGPDIAQVFRRGALFAYRIVDDRRNAIHAIEALPAASLAAAMRDFGATALPLAAPGAPDVIYAVSASGGLAPIAMRTQGVFHPLATALPVRAVHLIFGNRTIATLTTARQNGQPHIAVPPALLLDGHTNALASPTLGAHALQARRTPTAAERSAALALAAAHLHVAPARLEVRALTAIDLGHGVAIAGTVNVRGTATPRVDHRLFFIAEPAGAALTLTLAGEQTITVSEPLLEDPAEYLIDALDLGAGQVGVVTRIIGYDAASYAIYARTGATVWKPIFSGGGAAN
jgi:hypothetical protein